MVVWGYSRGKAQAACLSPGIRMRAYWERQPNGKGPAVAEVTIIIPNYNGIAYLPVCLDALRCQEYQGFETVVVDNGSADGSQDLIRRDYPEVKLVCLPDNQGFCGAVNAGIRASTAPFIILLNNDTQAAPGFVGGLLAAVQKSPRRFSCSAKMIQFYHRDRMDDAGNYYNALGWAFARGKGLPQENYNREKPVFAACGGAAIYRRDILGQIGCLDEAHFAYLEDLDLGYRARIHGYQNIFTPDAIVYHVGSGTTGSRYNPFKVRYSARNNLYLIYKNMPLLQILLNFPFLAAGFLIKLLFFAEKGFWREYASGLREGWQLCKKEKKVKFSAGNFLNYFRIQLELWVNILRILAK